jgi:2-oxoglutarate ferredoxin oxidoreductase subunit alpha
MQSILCIPYDPSTPILELLGDTYMKTGILVKQAESEITAVQMVLGSMYMGARAFTATSGGGFDLMTESISMSAMTEIPLVIVLGHVQGLQQVFLHGQVHLI